MILLLRRFFNDVRKHWNYIIYATRSQLKEEVISSYLGWLWIIFDPLGFMLIYTFIAGVVFKSTTEYFPVFVFSGLAVWNFFKNVVSSAVRLIVINRETVTKVYVPKFVLLLVMMFVNGFKFIVQFGLCIIFMIIFQVPVTWNVFWIIPILIVEFILSFGIGAIFMHVGVFLEDLANLTNLGMRLVFYATGIFYDISTKVPAPYNGILLYVNPMAYIITSFRNALIYSKGIQLLPLGMWLVIGIIFSLFGIRLIYNYENTYVKVMKG